MSTKSPEQEARLLQVFREVLENPKLEIGDDMGPDDISGWDSLVHVRLVVSIEQEFGVKFTTPDIASFQCVADAKRVIARAA